VTLDVPSTPQLSVLALARGPERLAEHALRAALGQLTPGVELVVAGDPNALRRARQLVDALNTAPAQVRWVESDSPKPGVVRNAAVRAARAPYLLLADGGEAMAPGYAASIVERLAGMLREQGASAQEVDAVLAPRPQRLREVPRLLAAVRAFSALPEAPALAAANKRIGNILKKSPEADAHVNTQLLPEPAEQGLYQAMQQLVPIANGQFDSGDYTGSLQTLAALRQPVDTFFDEVMVNAEQADLRLNRLGLLASLHRAMNRVAQLERLAA